MGSPSCIYLPFSKMHLSLLQRPLDTTGVSTRLAHVIPSCHNRSTTSKPRKAHSAGSASEEGNPDLRNETARCVCFFQNKGVHIDCLPFKTYGLLTIQTTKRTTLSLDTFLLLSLSPSFSSSLSCSLFILFF